MSTGSETFFLFICLNSNKFVLLSFFSLIKTIYPSVSTKQQPNNAKILLPGYLSQKRRHGHVSSDSELNMYAVFFVSAYSRLSESRDVAKNKTGLFQALR